MASCSSPGLTLSNQAHYPEGMVKRILPVPLSLLASIISATVKTILFPITTFFLMLGFGIKAVYECVSGRSAEKYAVAALLNFAGFAASAAFFGAAAFYFPFPVTIGLLFTATAVSIIFHLYKASKGVLC